MDGETAALLDALTRRVSELEQVQGAHRALISRHQSALKTVAQIMEIGKDVDLDRPTADSPPQDPDPRS